MRRIFFNRQGTLHKTSRSIYAICEKRIFVAETQYIGKKASKYIAMTPMMLQYQNIKKEYEDCILFYRLGDFYEMFFDDALTAHKALEITLTSRACGQDERAPMCGVPYHAADTYIARLIEKGFKVAICEQVEDAADAIGIVKREVIKVITPGTVTSDAILSENENNYLLSLYISEKNTAGISFCDISTGEIKATQINEEPLFAKIINEIVRINPGEIIINDTYNAFESQISDNIVSEIKKICKVYINIKNNIYFNFESAESLAKKHFKVTSLHGIGLSEMKETTCAMGALLSYLLETQKQSLSHINNLQIYTSSSSMSLDKATIKNLELLETLFEKKVQGSLLHILDKTLTAMGGRKIKQWIKAPLTDINEIKKRLDAVEKISDELMLKNNLRVHLKEIYDLERLTGKVACGNLNARDLIALKGSLAVIPDIKDELLTFAEDNELLTELNNKMDTLSDAFELIEKSIVVDPPFTIREGGIIKDGYSNNLDALKFSISDGKNFIADLENIEKEKTGIKSLKVGYTRVFGYYIEVTKSYFDLVPEHYIRKQTLANCERYITPELKEVESTVLNAEVKINNLEYQIFNEIKTQLSSYIPLVQTTSDALSTIDVLCSLAEVNIKFSYVKPSINNTDKIEITRGRHPVVEQTIADGIFVVNDTYIDGNNKNMLLITGPNMAGKSTYMRQTALIVLMAQIGSFVPAENADIGIVDKIFTRIGSSDNLAGGQSTFFVEMSELAYILNTATKKSLIILDEIGRGTSTYDGLSIAFAVVEHLCNSIKIKTLFATHYHELTKLEEKIPGFINLNVDVCEEGGEIIFLHKIVTGSASRSYGIHVAKLAGVPESVLNMAQEKLDELLNAGNLASSLGINQQISFFK